MIVFRYLLRPLGLEIEYVNITGKSDHIYLTFNQPSERQKLYPKIIVARQAQPQTNPGAPIVSEASYLTWYGITYID